MANGSSTVFKAARPSISVAGKDTPALTEGLLHLLITADTAGLYRCEATFGNWGTRNQHTDFLYFDRATLEFGKKITVSLPGNPAGSLFEGQIMGLEGHFPASRPPEITVLAEDRFQELRMTRRTRTFENVSDADVIKRVATDHGLTPQVDVNGPTYKVLAQVNLSDLAFLRDRVRSIDAELWMEGNTLHAQSRSKRNGGTLTLTYQQNLRAFTVLADLAWQRTGVTVSGWNVTNKDVLKYEATDAVLNGELNGDISGANVLNQTLGGRKEALVHTVPLASQEAQAEAEAVFKLGARRFVRGNGTADTDARLTVGSFVDLQGLGPLFAGKYYLSEVRHIFDGASGIRTEFTAERPGLGRAR